MAFPSPGRAFAATSLQLSLDLGIQHYAEGLLQTQLALRRQFEASNPVVTDPSTGTQTRSDPTRPATVDYEAPADPPTEQGGQLAPIRVIDSTPNRHRAVMSTMLSVCESGEFGC